MKTYLITAVIVLFVGTVLAQDPESDQVGVTSETFYNNEALNNNGRWIDVEKYGRCWQPAQVEQGWRPYTRGGFRHSDQCGWTWVSDETEAEWGWATFHYGRWLRLEGVGCEWAWVPGTVWGPAWVSWRSGKEPSCTCVGWAPLPPEIECKVGVGVNRMVDRRAEIGPDNYTFIEKKNFGRENYHQCGCIVERQRYVDIVRHTRNITNISYVRSSEIYRGGGAGLTIYNEGPDLDECDAEAVRYGGPRIAQIEINRVADISFFRESRGYRRFDGDVFQVFAPQVHINARIDRLPNAAMTVSFTKVSRGWEGVHDEGMRKQLKQQFATETKGLRDNAPATLNVKTKRQMVEYEKSLSAQKALRDAGYSGTFQGKGKDVLKDFQASGLDARDYAHKNADKFAKTNDPKGSKSSTLPGASPEPTNAWLNIMKDAKSGSTGDKSGNQAGANTNAPPAPSVPPGVASKDRNAADATATPGSRFSAVNRHHRPPKWLTDAQKTNGWSDDQALQVLRDYNQKSLKIQDDKSLTDAQKQASYGDLEKKSSDKNAPSLVDPSIKDAPHWLTTENVPDLPDPDADGTRIGSAVSTNIPSDTGNADGSTGGGASQTGHGHGSGHSSQNGNNPSGSTTGNTQIGSAVSTTIPSGTPQIGSATSVDEKGNVTNVPDSTDKTRIGTAVSTDIPSDSGNSNGGQGGSGPNGQGQGSNQTRIGTAVSTNVPSGDENGKVPETQAGEMKAAVTDPAEIEKIRSDFQAKFDAQMTDGSGSSTEGAGAANGKTGNATQSSAGNLNNAQGQTDSNQSNQGLGKNRRHPGESFKNRAQSNAATNGNSTGSSNTGNQSATNGQTLPNNNSKFNASNDASGGSENAGNSFQGKQDKGTRRPGQRLNSKNSNANTQDQSQIGSATSMDANGKVSDMPPGGSDGSSTGGNRNTKLNKKGKVTKVPPTGGENGNESVNAQNGKQNGKHNGKHGSQVMNQSQGSTSNSNGMELKQQSSAGSAESNQSGNQSGKSQRKLSKKQQRQLDSQGQSQSDTSSVSNNSGGGSRGGKHHKQSQSEPTLKIAPQDTATSTSQSSSSSNGGGGGGGGKQHKQQNNKAQVQQQSSQSSSQGDGGNGGGRGGKKKGRHQPEAQPTP